MDEFTLKMNGQKTLNITYVPRPNTFNALSPYSPNALSPKALGFTMAEILLSLTIIGVVAAITLPSLMANINERTWNTQRKALYARMSQAIAMMPQVGGYGKYSGTNTDGVVTVTEDTAAETFLTEGLSKVLKINNICDADHLADCGIPSSYTNIAGTSRNWPTKLSELNSVFNTKFVETNPDGDIITWINPQKDIDTKAAAFETQNGESIALYYNPQCISDKTELINTPMYMQPKMCANFIYDLNGNKGPNTVGKDVGFITSLYSVDPVVISPIPTKGDSGYSTYESAAATCRTDANDNRLPNLNEIHAMFYNMNLIWGSDIEPNGLYFSSTLQAVNQTWRCSFITGTCYTTIHSNKGMVRCVKR